MTEKMQVQCPFCTNSFYCDVEEIASAQIQCQNSQCKKVFSFKPITESTAPQAHTPTSLFAENVYNWLLENMSVDDYDDINGIEDYMHVFFNDFADEKRFAHALQAFLKAEKITGADTAQQLYAKIQEAQKYEPPGKDFQQKMQTRFLVAEIDAYEQDIQNVLAKPAVSSRTIDNYFQGASKPNHTAKGRKIIYLLCFALQLDGTQARRFFETVYLDRIDSCDPESLFFIYCLNHNRSFCFAERLYKYYQEAKKESLLEKTSGAEQNAAACTTTYFMQTTQAPDEDWKKLFDDLLENATPFSAQNHRTIQIIKETQQTIQGTATGISKECTKADNLLKKLYGKNCPPEKEINVPTDALKEYEPTQNLAQEFWNALPDADQTLFPRKSKSNYENMNFHDIRNLLILTAFGNYWLNETNIMDKTADDFLQELNTTLKLRNMNTLYEKNIFDRFIICCTVAFQAIEKLFSDDRGLTEEADRIGERTEIFSRCVNELLHMQKGNVPSKAKNLFHALCISIDDYLDEEL